MPWRSLCGANELTWACRLGALAIPTKRPRTSQGIGRSGNAGAGGMRDTPLHSVISPGSAAATSAAAEALMFMTADAGGSRAEQARHRTAFPAAGRPPSDDGQTSYRDDSRMQVRAVLHSSL